MLDLDVIDGRSKAATPGPWFQGREGIRYENPRDIYSHREPIEGVSTDIPTTDADAEFIVHAREDVPALVAEVRRLRCIVQDVRELVMNTDGDYLDGSDFQGLVGEIQQALREHGELPSPTSSDARSEEDR